MWRVTSGSSEPVCSASFTKTSLFSYEFIVSSGEVSVVLKYLHLNHILCSLVQGLLFIINVNADSAASRSPSQLQQGKNSFCSQLITNMQFNGWSIHLLLPHYTINEPSLFYWTHTHTDETRCHHKHLSTYYLSLSTSSDKFIHSILMQIDVFVSSTGRHGLTYSTSKSRVPLNCLICRTNFLPECTFTSPSSVWRVWASPVRTLMLLSRRQLNY